MGKEIELKERFTFEGEGRGSNVSGNGSPFASIVMIVLFILLLVVIVFLIGKHFEGQKIQQVKAGIQGEAGIQQSVPI